ncbi:hypothetical protein HU200_043137 [Digitaria exilis]|uniref:F-box domain-containing protein n=1 Tax=Digitaria exilis TaxID=1010633 RepID=A0A835B477_9POAL|nr:hypothetical protein HU200_043137 [Digitaria exilis]
MDEGVVDRLSALSDDLLRRILHLVPSKEAASTSALSRRWGSLWRSSGAVDLAAAIRYGHDEIYSYQAMQETQRAAEDAFCRAAAASLAAFAWTPTAATPTSREVAMRLPAVTTLVLALCGGLLGQGAGQNRIWALEIDAPRLQSLVYKGLLRQFQLRSAATELARADLHFLKDTLCYGKERTRELFWQFVQSLSSAKALKLTVNAGLKEIAAIGKARRAQLLCPLPNVQRLELEGWHHPTSTTAAVAIANLLHCCHALGDLTLKLSDVPPDSHKDDGSYYASDRLDYTRSIDRFIRRRRSSTISMEDSNSSGVRYHDDVHDIPGLSGHSFACLQKSLRRVSLQFRLGDSSSSCLGPRLVKFFAQNAMVLE